MVVSEVITLNIIKGLSSLIGVGLLWYFWDLIMLILFIILVFFFLQFQLKLLSIYGKMILYMYVFHYKLRDLVSTYILLKPTDMFSTKYERLKNNKNSNVYDRFKDIYYDETI